MLTSSIPASRNVMLLIFLGLFVFFLLQIGSVDSYRRLGVASLVAGRLIFASKSPEGPTDTTCRNDTLGFASRIYVLSLPMRTDRRKDMEHLRKTLGLRWTYMEAVNASNPMISKILHAVSLLRDTSSPGSPFTWPDDNDTVSNLQDDIASWSPGFFSAEPAIPITQMKVLPCATQNNTVTPYTSALPEYKLLTPARIACWYSHVSLIHTIANDHTLRAYDAVLVLEDDVDMERDIHQRLKAVWPSLPEEWDIVYLGHCWSNEGATPSLKPTNVSSYLNTTVAKANATRHTFLHPSTAPLCTHAYALTRLGARRLLLHLRYPPFAYSRSIDRALAWLIQSRRIRSFSVVPSVVVQRKVGGSDVMPGKGSGWREGLADSVFGV